MLRRCSAGREHAYTQCGKGYNFYNLHGELLFIPYFPNV